MKKAGKCILTILLVFSFIFTGCEYVETIKNAVSLEEEPQATQSYQAANQTVSAAAHFGEGLCISMRTPKTLNPLVNEDVTVDSVLNLIFEKIAVVDETGRAVPDLASEVNFSEDGMSATINLRNDIFFSDGEQMDASDLVYSFEVIKEYEETCLYADTVSEIESMEIVASAMVRVYFNKPQGGMIYSLCFPVIARHHYMGRTALGGLTDLDPVGSGPYKLKSIKPVRDMYLEANSFYKDGEARINTISVLMTDSYETDMQSFDQGIIDAVDSDMISFGIYSGSRDIESTAYSAGDYVFLGFNFRNIIFEDKRVREAVASSLDKERIRESIFLEQAVLSNSAVNPECFMALSDIKDYPFSQNTAGNLLFQAGFRDNDLDGTLDREAGGITLEISFKLIVNRASEQNVKIAGMLKENMEALGLLIDVEECDFETYKEKLTKGEFDIFIGTANFAPKPDFRFMFHSSAINEGENYFYYSNETLDSYIQEAEAAIDETAYLSAVSKIQAHIAEEIPCVSIAFSQRALLNSRLIKGEKKPVSGNVYNNITDWYIS